MTTSAVELINQHKQIVTRGYYTNSDKQKIRSLDLPEGITVSGNTLSVAGKKLVTVVNNGNTRDITLHNTVAFFPLVNKLVANYNAIVKRNANGMYSATDTVTDMVGDDYTVTFTERFKDTAKASTLSIDDLLIMGKA